MTDELVVDHDRSQVDAYLRAWQVGLREVYERHAAEIEKPPCKSCAVAPHTDNWQGWDRTVLSVIDSTGGVVGERDPAIFYCHDTQRVEGRRFYLPRVRAGELVPCRAILLVKRYPAELAAVRRAAWLAFDALATPE